METENRDAAAVQAFFEQWSLYRRVVDKDYLFHGRAMPALARWLDGRAAPFAFCDLGCGDASFTSAVLSGRALKSYTGVDVSGPALELAKKNTEALLCPREFRLADFSDPLKLGLAAQDVIYIGLSFHHLLAPEKARFFSEIRGLLAPGGAFVFFEPILREEETRAEYMKRWVAFMRAHWEGFTPDELDAIEGHVTGNDYPEKVSDFGRMARAAGFPGMEVLHRDEAGFYAVIAFS